MKSSKKQGFWRNRIIGYGEKPAENFNFHPKNWKIHTQNQLQAIDAILTAIGWVTGVIVSVNSGLLLDGHARISEALRRNPKEIIPYTEVDLSEEEGAKILALLDPIGFMARADNEKLSLLTEGMSLGVEALDEIISQGKITDIDLEEFFEEKKEEVLPSRFTIELSYKKDDYDLVKRKLSDIDQSPSAAVKKLLAL